MGGCKPTSEVGCVEYHRWYYDTAVWERATFLGVPCFKSVSDMWNYQEVLAELVPSLVVEFGSCYGGSALFFSTIGRAINPKLKVLSVDLHHGALFERARQEEAVEWLTASSSDAAVAERIAELRRAHPGPVFFILDSDHRKAHVLAELALLRPLTQAGDYVVVEDGNINGHPVLPGWGEGPFEAIAEYHRRHPGDYRTDAEREAKFGFTFAPNGFLIRQ